MIDKLLGAYSDIAEVLPRVDKLKTTFGDKTDFQQVLGLIYSDIIEFHQRAYKIFRRKAWHLWFALDWGLFDRRFKLILENLASHCDLLDREAAALHFSEMKTMRDKRQLEDEKFEQYRHDQMVREVFAWLAAADESQEDYLNDISDRRLLETCNWILEEAQIRSWTEDDNKDAVLWMTGIPGAGKSFLCSFIIQHLETWQNVTTLYFFCGRQESDRSRCALVLRTLAIQLLRQNRDVALLVYQAYLQKGSNCSITTMKRILKQVLPTIHATRIILDGIDEYNHSEQQEILKTLLDLQKLTGDNCKLLISSRDEPLIEKVIPSKVHFKLDGRTAQGLKLYIRDKVESLEAKFSEIDVILFARIRERLECKAKGMFLWVRLVSTMLEQQSTEAEIEAAIDELPDGLDEAYGLILSRFRDLNMSERNRVFRILFWICVAYRPIGIHDLADGISLKPGQTILSRRTRSGDYDRDILNICAPLIEKSGNGSLGLVHFTAKEYLLHQQSGPFIESAKAHFSIAFSCITNLTSALVLVPRYNHGAAETDLETGVVQGCYGLQAYGHQFWFKHVEAFLEETSELNQDMTDLISALTAFSKVWKRYPTETSNSLDPQISFSGSHKLIKYPLIINLISSWLRFESMLSEKLTSFANIEVQEQWQIQTDETYLSLIHSRMREITERLLGMKSSALPPHIDKDDHEAFIARFRFTCRFISCDHDFDSSEVREAHEVTHMITFPCLQCDFADRGFSSRKDLEKHTRKYHTSPEDFEIPSNLYAAARSLKSTNTAIQRFSASKSWNEQGRKDLQQGFHQVLANIESRVGLEGLATDQQVNRHSNPERSDNTLTLINKMREKNDSRLYQTLTNFRNDIRKIGNISNDGVTVERLNIELICEQELEKAMSGFPGLASFNFAARKYDSSEIALSDHQDSFHKVANVHHDLLDNDLLNKKKPHWSPAEEKAIPKLLEQFGRDLIQIADCLKTKHVSEIDRYLKVNMEMSTPVDPEDARSLLEIRSTQPSNENREPEPDKVLIDEPDPTTRVIGGDSFEQVADETETYGNNRLSSVQTAYKDMSQPGLDLENSTILAKPVRPKRRKLLRALCQHCCKNMADEYALRRHVRRFHKAVRDVWICNDVSIDKMFLAQCKPCLKRKRYRSERNAAAHLQSKHFVETTSMEILRRWITKTEEPNPSYKKSTVGSSLIGNENQVPDQSPQTKRRRIMRKSSLLETAGIFNSASMLPAMRDSPGGSNTLKDQELDDDNKEASDSSPTDLESLDRIALLPDVSFDSFLPGLVTMSQDMEVNSPPHRKNRAYIKPDQVQRLPYLNPMQKIVTHDQVEALYQILNQEPVDSKKYEQNLKSLSSLSQNLLRRFRKWQRDSALAPNMPFSL